MASSWREQYERMKRWRKRVQRSRDDHDDVRDNFFAFTQACYHLVDWLENDKSQPIRRSRAEQFVKESRILRFCGDICSGSKHARLEGKKVRVTDKPIRLSHETAVWELSVEYQDQMARTDQILRGRGYPNSVSQVQVSHKVEAMKRASMT